MTKLLKKILGLIPPTFSTWMYTRALRYWPLRQAANALLRAIIPKSISIPEGIVMLNKNDVAVSGQLALGVFETFEVDTFRKNIKEGMTVVDIGANLGYFTVIAANRVGISGKILAYEPEPENYGFLTMNISANKLSHVTTVKMGLSDNIGEHRLYLTEDNKGTHSMVDHRNSGRYISIETETLDASLDRYGSPTVDVIKMDIEGAEALAIDGMRKTIGRSPRLIMFTEFYPKGIKRFGKNPLSFLNDLGDLGFAISIIDEDRKMLVPLPREGFEGFISNFSTKGEPVKNLYAVKG